AYDGGFPYARVFVNRALDLARGDVGRIPYYYVPDAACVVVIAARFPYGAVAALEPAVLERLAGGLVVVPVAGHDHRPFYPYLAGLAVGEVFAVFVDYPEPGVADRLPYEAGPFEIRFPGYREPDGLGHSVAEHYGLAGEVEISF